MSLRRWEAGPVTIEQVAFAPPSAGTEGSWNAHCLQLHLGAPMWCRLRQAGQRSEHRFVRGDLTLITAGTDASCWRDEPASFVRLQVSRACFEHAGVVPIAPRAGLHRFRDPVLREITLSIAERLEREGDASLCYVESAAHFVALHLAHRAGEPLRAPSRAGLSRAVLQRVLARLHDALDQNPSLTELAQLAGLEVAHFSRMFKRSTGLAPHQYLQQLRLERARLLLTSSDQSVLQIGLSLGFTNPSHFAAFYRRHAGMSPREQRKLAQGSR